MRATMKASVMVGAYRSATRRTPPATLPLQVPSVPLEVAPVSHELSSEAGTVDASPVMRPSSEVDDWEFVEEEEEESFDAIHPQPRLVFGPVPTLEEATEAALELKDAVERVYFSSPAPENAETSTEQLNSENLETKTSVGSESGTISLAMPKNVFQAFALLQGSPEAQSVVASLASDVNVWNAVMQNEKIIQFYKSHQKTLAPIESAESDGGVAAESDSKEPSSFSCEVQPSEQPSENTRHNGFTSFAENIIMKVSEMVNNLADFFRDLMAPSRDEESSTPDYNAEVTLCSSFIALAIATILVLLFRRVA